MNKREEKILYKNIFGRTIVDDRKEGHAESAWECAEHIKETGVIIQEGVTFEDIALAGVPICHVCGMDMILTTERWIEE